MSIKLEYYKLKEPSQWILVNFFEMLKKLDYNLSIYELAHNIDELYRFLWDKYANFYIEYLKTAPEEIAFAQELFKYFIFSLYPYDPFNAESIWLKYYKKINLEQNINILPESLLAYKKVDINWKQKIYLKYNLTDENLKKSQLEFEEVIKLISYLRSNRGLFSIANSDLLICYIDSHNFEKYYDYIKHITNTKLSFFEEKKDQQKYYIQTTNNYNLYLDIIPLIKNKQIEILNNQKQLERIKKQISDLQKQLQNDIFLAKASEEIVSQKQNDLKERQKDLQTLNFKQDFLNSLNI